MDNWNVHHIVKILVKDATLLQARRRLARSLYIPEQSLQEFENECIRNNDLHSYFCNVLAKWKSINGDEATIPSLIKILRENKYAASADQLNYFYNGISAPVTVFGVKDPVFNFVGREQELNELNEWFTIRGACIVLISAMGGKGKTELCRRFIQQLPKDVDILVTWFSGDGLEQFQQSLFEIGQAMNVQTTDSAEKSLTVDKIIENIFIKRKSKKWVVIIDNVEETFQDFNSAVDAFQKNGAFVVVTSRRSGLDCQADEFISLRDLEDKDARKLVKSALKKKKSKKMVEKLCKCLQNCPLALQQAVAYIKYKRNLEEDFGIEEYLDAFYLSPSNAVNHKISSTGYDHTILIVFELTLKIMNATDNRLTSMTLLRILSLVLPDGIQKEFLKRLFSYHELVEFFEPSLSILKSFSLIRVNKEEVSVHRVVQKLTRDKIKTENKFISVIDKIFEELTTDKLKKEEIVQVIQIWKNAFQELEIIKTYSNLAVQISDRLRELSLYREMKEFSKITFQQFVTSLGPNHIHTLRMQFQLGRALHFNGEYEKALSKLKVFWEKEKKSLGEEHEETLNCAGRIALVLHSLKRLDESLVWFERVVESKIKVHGEKHHETMITKHNMAMLLNDQGEREKAFLIYKQVLDWREKEDGHEHPDTMMTRHNIATCLHGQGNFVEAKKELEEVLKLRVKVLGEEHADTLKTKSWLSFTLYSLGQEEGALEMMEQVLISQEEVLGPNHPHTNITKYWISKWKNPLIPPLSYQTIKNKCIIY